MCSWDRQILKTLWRTQRQSVRSLYNIWFYRLNPTEVEESDESVVLVLVLNARCSRRGTRSTSQSSSSSSRETSWRIEWRRSVRGKWAATLVKWTVSSGVFLPEPHVCFLAHVQLQSYIVPMSRNPSGEERDASRGERAHRGPANGNWTCPQRSVDSFKLTPKSTWTGLIRFGIFQCLLGIKIERNHNRGALWKCQDNINIIL